MPVILQADRKPKQNHKDATLPAHPQELYLLCVRGEGVQGVLTLFCSGAAQVCHDNRVVELKEQLEVEEEDGDRQEEEVEVEREKRVKEVRP